MTKEDKLPVLALHSDPNTRRHQRPTDPDKLSDAFAALRQALEPDTRTPVPTPVPEAENRPSDSFTPVGAPTVWSTVATPNAPKPVGRGGVAAGAVTRTGQTPDTAARRITSIYLPRFAMDRWDRWMRKTQMEPAPEAPVALAIDGGHGPVIYATNDAAQTAGVHIGSRVVDMRALCPDLRIDYADTNGDAAALGRLMLWTRRWCPWTAVDGHDGLIMDTTGSDHLWGGEAAMLRDIEGRLAQLGFRARIATAPTHGAAWALSRIGGTRETCTPDMHSARMNALPVRALRIDSDTCLLLQRLGLKTVGDLAAVPRISLARRFSRAPLAQNPLLRLDQMMGDLAEPISAAEDPPRFSVQANLSEPIQDPTPHLPDLCHALCHDLAAQDFGARRICLSVFRTDGEVRHITVTTAQASRDADHLCRLFDGKLDALDPGFGFDLITLTAPVSESLKRVQTRLDRTNSDGTAFAQLIDRLRARLGAHKVTQLNARESHIPERAFGHIDMLTRPLTPKVPFTTNRPTKLLSPPEEIRVLYQVPEGPPAQFAWRKVTHRIVRYAGPERVAPEWWHDMPSARLRDYYKVEVRTAQRYWLYRDGVLGDSRGTPPRWFMHGLHA